MTGGEDMSEKIGALLSSEKVDSIIDAEARKADEFSSGYDGQDGWS